MKLKIPVFVLFCIFNGNAQQLIGRETQVLQTQQNEIPLFNLKIVQAVKSNIGKRVGTGECWDLVQIVLDENGAKWERTEKFGTKLDLKKDTLYPGDIIMFKKVVFKGSISNGSEYTLSMYNHYAIVMQVSNNELLIAHQNTDEFGKKVGLSTIKLLDLKKGTLTFFRPVKS